MRHTDVLQMYRASPIFLKSQSSGVNQYGLKPQTAYDYLNPTNLINFGRGTKFDNLGVRRSDRGEIDSSPSMNGTAVFQQAKMLGLSSGDAQLNMCQGETMALRVCMAKGTEPCDRESSILDTCLGRVGELRRAISTAGFEYGDWFIQNVSDNHTKPFQHRPHDWREHYAQEKIQKSDVQGGRAYGKQPKLMAWNARYTKTEGYGKRPRLPINK
ncbi:Hypothetical protein, putative [Bodo saltans]|uniref:Uncharacterized protein n=1 Tax=Bodo saltans TaxID=75058 RepID=A0A0S4IQC1_BODSA|nr:Hypothetical protein, putative [Bodo saltans]|eukprot:CUF24528.1 Hypothetical protein, putative [Bodo saltans]